MRLFLSKIITRVAGKPGNTSAENSKKNSDIKYNMPGLKDWALCPSFLSYNLMQILRDIFDINKHLNSEYTHP